MSELALTVSLLALAAALGLWIGNWKIRSVGLGIGGVLFGGSLLDTSPKVMACNLIKTCCILFKNLA